MATPESYRPDESGSSPAPAVLPDRPPDRFQFSVKSLLWFMFASALLAADALYLAAATETARQAELAEGPDLVPNAAYCLARLGRLNDRTYAVFL